MKTLVTGASGFVGAHLLASLGPNTTVIGRKPVPFHDGPYFFADFDGFEVNEAAFVNIDVVVHCAARAHVMNDQESDPLSVFRKVNTYSTIKLAEMAAQNRVKRFIYISSIKVNGEDTSLTAPFTANDVPKPEDAYGISKLEAEQQLLEIAKNTGMEVVIIRPPLVYGSGVKGNFRTLQNVVNKRIPLPFRSITKNKRSMVFVGNLVNLIETCISHPNAGNKIFLVSDDHDISTAEMIDKMSSACRKGNFSLPVPVFLLEILGKVTGRSDMINRLTGSLQVDISETKKILDWQPLFNITEGFDQVENFHTRKVK